MDRNEISRAIALRAQMSSLDLDILDELCLTLVTRNAVVLTDDLVQRRRILRFGDPVELVLESLRNLNQQGWVRYTLGEFDIPTYIRPTQLGYHVAGYLFRAGEVGRKNYRRSNDDATVKHPGDGTEFRNHGYSAQGGPIEAMELWRHLTFYPDHLDLHAQAMREMQEERSDMASLREVIMDGVFDAPNKLTANQLWEQIKDKRPMSMMDVVSQTWNLQKSGELTFKERKGRSTGSGEHHDGDLVDITLTPYGDRNVRKRRGLEVGPPDYNRPFIKVTMDDVLAGTGMKPIEPVERPKAEVTDRLTAWERPAPTPERVVAAEILAESVGAKVTVDNPLRMPWEQPERGVQFRPQRSTVTDGGRHPVGKDMTDPARHGPKAKGGPVTRERVAPEPALPQVAAIADQVPAEAPQVPAEAEQKQGDRLIPSPMTGFETRFPLIWRITNRESKVMEAAAKLEEAGLDDLAVQAMEQLKFTDLEKEVLELVKELG